MARLKELRAKSADEACMLTVQCNPYMLEAAMFEDLGISDDLDRFNRLLKQNDRWNVGPCVRAALRTLPWERASVQRLPKKR